VASSPSCASRLVDTATRAARGGPLAARLRAGVPVVGRCGVPPTAKAVAVNVTATGSTGSGFLRAYAAFPESAPPTSVLNFNAGATRANNAIVALSAAGQVAMFNGMSAGTTHVVVDVVGYFE
jgi:hypothetical protein